MTLRLWLKYKLGFKLSGEERGRVARWITRNVKTSIEETLWELNQ